MVNILLACQKVKCYHQAGDIYTHTVEMVGSCTCCSSAEICLAYSPESGCSIYSQVLEVDTSLVIQIPHSYHCYSDVLYVFPKLLYFYIQYVRLIFLSAWLMTVNHCFFSDFTHDFHLSCVRTALSPSCQTMMLRQFLNPGPEYFWLLESLDSHQCFFCAVLLLCGWNVKQADKIQEEIKKLTRIKYQQYEQEYCTFCTNLCYKVGLFDNIKVMAHPPSTLIHTSLSKLNIHTLPLSAPVPGASWVYLVAE